MEVTRRPGLGEVVFVWLLFGVVAVEVFVTYLRVSPSDLYHVSGTGLEAAASRVLVYLGYPTSLVVLALLPVVVDRLATPAARLIGLLALALCATVMFPGVVDQGDLDARLVNVVAPVGVAAALGLTLTALARGGVGASAPFRRFDWVRIALAAVLLLAAIPWIAADLGFSISDAPVLGSIFLGEQQRTAPGEETRAAVHLGHHHGMDGVMFVWSALALSRVPARMKSALLRTALIAYLALAVVYGLANALEDFWLEQIVKRGVTDTAIPAVLRPGASWAWAAILGVTLVICLAALRVVRVDKRQEGGLP
jgi:hypothetical protein